MTEPLIFTLHVVLPYILLIKLYVFPVKERERETETETERQGQRQRERQTDRQTDRQRQRDRDRDRERDRDTVVDLGEGPRGPGPPFGGIFANDL